MDLYYDIFVIFILAKQLNKRILFIAYGRYGVQIEEFHRRAKDRGTSGFAAFVSIFVGTVNVLRELSS